MMAAKIPARTGEDQALFDRSGQVFAATPLVSFLYSLMIDHLTPGQVERLVRESTHPGTTTYTNGWVAEYAKDVATRLLGGPLDLVRIVEPHNERDTLT
jgi:hypothetical protein